jgi:hypothetical protein
MQLAKVMKGALRASVWLEFESPAQLCSGFIFSSLPDTAGL